MRKTNMVNSNKSRFNRSGNTKNVPKPSEVEKHIKECTVVQKSKSVKVTISIYMNI